MDENLSIMLTRDELSIIRAGLRETLEALEEWELETRVGFTTGEVRKLQQKLKELSR
ncbi:MAG: hypothetical protein INR66_23160 [Gordonia polyisoprenivorans]|nr:hypothetical protein [Gordonia polyisoprenivorans]